MEEGRGGTLRPSTPTQGWVHAMSPIHPVATLRPSATTYVLRAAGSSYPTSSAHSLCTARLQQRCHARGEEGLLAGESPGQRCHACGEEGLLAGESPGQRCHACGEEGLLAGESPGQRCHARGEEGLLAGESPGQRCHARGEEGLLTGESPGQHASLTSEFDQQLLADLLRAAGRLAMGAILEAGQRVLDLLSVALQRSHMELEGLEVGRGPRRGVRAVYYHCWQTSNAYGAHT